MNSKAFKTNQANLKRLQDTELYELLYSQYVSPIFRGQISRELERRIPKVNIAASRYKAVLIPDRKHLKFRMLDASLWEIEQASMQIKYPEPVEGY
jgi:hypothetical protein